jgi:hypothetical protein
VTAMLEHPASSDVFDVRLARRAPGSNGRARVQERPVVTRRVRKQRRLGVVAIVLVAALLNAMAPGEPTVTQRLLASAILAMCGGMVIAWWTRREWAHPFLVAFAGVYTIYYAVPVFLLEHFSRLPSLPSQIPDDSIEEALWLAAGGLATCVAGYRGLEISGLRSRLPAFRMEWPASLANQLLFALLGVVGVVAYYASATQVVPAEAQQVLYFLGDLSIVGSLALFAIQLKRGLPLAMALFLWGVLLPVRIALGLATGFASQGIEVGLGLVMVYVLVRGRIPWRTAGVVTFALLLIMPARQEFRALTWRGEAADRSLVERTLLYPAIIRDYLMAGEFGRGAEGTISRLSYLMTFAEVVERTGTEVPFWNGETYRALLFKPIPRFFFPDKPVMETAQAFGHRYAFLEPDDTTTSYNLPQLIELYVNFGVVGVVAGMFVIGALYGVVTRFFDHRDAGVGAMMTGAYLSAKLLFIESSAGLVFGGLVWNLVFVALLHAVLGGRLTGGRR